MADDDAQAPSGDQPQSDPYDGVDGFEPPARTEDDGHPLADNKFDIEAFADVLKLTFNRLKESPVLIALVGLASISLLWSLFVGSAQFVGYLFLGSTGSGIVGLVLTFVGMILYPVMLLVVIAQWTLYRPGAQLLFGRSIETDEPMELLKSTTGLLIPVGLALIGYFFVTALGLLACGVGSIIAAVLFCQAPYLVAARDFDLVEAFKASLNRTLEHWHIVAMAFGSVFVLTAGVGTIFGCVAGTIMGFLGPLNYVMSPVIDWLIGTSVAIGGFIVYLGAFATIDELEGLDEIQW